MADRARPVFRMARWIGVGLALTTVAACGAQTAPTPRATPASPMDVDARARAFLRGEDGGGSCADWLERLGGVHDAVVRGDVAAQCGDEAAARVSYDEAWDDGEHGCGLALARLEAWVRARDDGAALAVATSTLDEARCRPVALRVARFARTLDSSLAERAIAQLRASDSDDGEALGELVRLHVECG